jgi:hypothetical protein
LKKFPNERTTGIKSHNNIKFAGDRNAEFGQTLTAITLLQTGCFDKG